MTYAEVTQFGNSGQIHFLDSADPVVSDGQLLIEIQSAGMNFSDSWRDWVYIQTFHVHRFDRALKWPVVSHPLAKE